MMIYMLITLVFVFGLSYVWRKIYSIECYNQILEKKIVNLKKENKDLQDLATGTRYLLVNDYVTPDGAQPLYNWLGIDNTPIEAYASDIIEFNGSHWSVVFDHRYETTVEYVTNLTTAVQYRWNGTAWTKSYEGYYPAGKWQITI